MNAGKRCVWGVRSGPETPRSETDQHCAKDLGSGDADMVDIVVILHCADSKTMLRRQILRLASRWRRLWYPSFDGRIRTKIRVLND